MIQRYFGLSHLPFDRALAPADLFQSQGWQELSARLDYIVRTRSLGVITGEIGAGKSTAIRALASRLDPIRHPFLYIADSALEPRGFYREALAQFGITPAFHQRDARRQFDHAFLDAWRSASAIQPGDLVLLAMFLWWLGYTVIYALRLPVTYQHGRYLMPAMPVFFLLGLLGTVWLLSDLPLAQKWRRRLRFAVALTIAGVTLSFYALGARSYSNDVAIIQTEMVQTAHWVAQNTPPDALVAAHDIGALGYYADRQLVDLAGLISPEVIPFIRDETRLVAYLDERQVDYLVTFPGWYPQLIQNRPLLYTTGGLSAPAQGGENMAVYRWLLTP